MVRNRLWWARVLSVWLVVGVAPGWAEEPDNNLLLRDGEHSITVEEYQRMLLAMPEAGRARYQSGVEQRVELLNYINRTKRMATEAERSGLSDQPEVQARLAVARLEILSAALLERYQRGLQDPDFDKLAHEHYLVNQERYRIPERRALAQIEFKVVCECERASKRALAETVLAKLQAGEPFEVLAEQYSDDRLNAVNRGGRLPVLIPRSDTPDAFNAAAFALDLEHPLSNIVEAPRGFYLIRLLERHEATQSDFESVKTDIINQLRGRYRTVQQADYVSQFSASPAATINEELLKKQAPPQ